MTNPSPAKTADAFMKEKSGSNERDGKGIPMEDVLAEFGMTADDFPLNK